MNNNIYDKVSASPVFESMVRKRNRFALLLSAVILIAYYAFVLFASTDPSGFAARISEGSSWPVGLLAAWGVQLLAFLLTGVYVNRANREFDEMNRNVVGEALR